jgi:EamA domain-containing membrane protein RarD
MDSAVKPKLFENSRGAKSSSIIIEYVFLGATMAIVLASFLLGRDIPVNTVGLLKWLGSILVTSVEGYKINERICDIRDRKNS